MNSEPVNNYNTVTMDDITDSDVILKPMTMNMMMSFEITLGVKFGDYNDCVALR